MSNTAFESVSPVLRVAELSAAIAYYTEKLGFQVRWQSPVFANVGRGRCCIFLSQGDQGAGRAWVWAGVEDVDAVYEEYQASGAKIRNPPTNYPWSCEMQVEDLDGNVLRLGSDRKAGQPIGEWLDENGQRWRSVDGDWQKAE
ncbi:catechol 2,3-dioxygenase-like lactoylglutathione lyase family enzyme [Rhizomicrobium palustre]|uniref:Catechol 2,3-dioxygenase-like lactoylglutathione lyase family enzyme n=1 Tax=Rhizomicrobium palustre TaxID=189966 RepID=A0A846MYN0_9PROT|nr:glyoxalase superfamily protein [Rhizomicrobium palustre]NIK88201.1 catechol 2,3-dioxygenase-like lactoylglutathione lyase family enzyme [Rhizomicrobium palustre]